MSQFFRRARRSVGLAAVVVSLVATAAVVGAGPALAAKAKPDPTAVLKVGVPIEDEGGVWFDPGSVTVGGNPSGRLWIDLIYDTMIHQTADGKGAPGLATKWEATDPQTVVLTLRDGVKFSNGEAFTAAAVKKAWDRTLASGRPNLPAEIVALKSTDVVDDHTVKITLSRPIAKQWIDEVLRSANFLAVPAPSTIDAGTVATKPIGAGPYAFASYSTGNVTLTANKTYWNPKGAPLGGVQFLQVANGAPAVNALQAGTVDLIWSVPPDSLDPLKSAGFAVTTTPSERQFFLPLCPTKGVFANKAVRQALNGAFDRAAIDAAALFGTGQPNTLVLSSTSPYFDKALAKTVKYDPKKAAAAIKAAGVAPGTKVSVLVPAQAPYPAVAELVQADLKKIGLDAQITESTSYVADVTRLQPDLAVASIDPTLYLLSFAGESPLDPCGYANPQIVADLEATTDASKTEAQVQAAYSDLQKTMLDDSPAIFLNLQGNVAAHTKRVQNLTVINAPYGPQFFDVFMTK